MDKVINEVRLTDDYGKFKKLQGNRDVDDARVARIRESISKVGFVNGPIIVNEKFEIVDGQGRLEVCQMDKIPVPYVVIDGIGIDECISMNINQSNWKTVDYIKAYADLGRPDYIRFHSYLIDNYKRQSGLRLSLTVLHWAAFHTALSNNDSKIRKGTLIFSQEQYNKANEMLSFFDEFKDVHTNNKSLFFPAIGYCTFFEGVDRYRLVKTVTSAKPRTFMSLGNTRDAIDAIEDVYNYRTSQKVHIDAAYLDYLRDVGVGAATEKKQEGRRTMQ